MMKLAATYPNRRHFILNNIYSMTPLNGDRVNPPKLLDPKCAPSLDTLLLFVILYVLPRQWPILVPVNLLDPEKGPSMLLSQLPGEKEFQAVSAVLHPDQRQSHQLNTDEQSDPVIEPSGPLCALLNSAFDI
jgi:hypothetical protein